MTRIKKYYWQKTFVYIFALVLTGLSVSLPLTSVQPSTLVKTTLQSNNVGNIFDKIRRFVFPPAYLARGAPTGRRKGAASRKGCPQTVLDLTALVPQNSWGLTFAEQPTFWFYISSLPEGSRNVEFVLQDENGSRQQYHTRFTLPATPGIISLNLSSNQPYNLQIDHRYHWYLQVYCDPQNPSTYVFVDGSVQRVAQNAHNANTIWYDLLTNSGNRLRASPQDPERRETWVTLLKDVGLEKLAQAPLLPCCTSEK
ncbi:DUF928 domain-containing protein [Aetokthonos hydrillicola Thurmond2011]|jgi:hypothetical protein|uniref:DUF928 domain-containing protein n=1 Tax=Aetokthonos hydrillicola Thurmond2011 TaxID=2712845 RepID=A0AAP5I393_9CYAN|nr:DUF928 domain-containing protein [Aetokthonos hydrillicola]MBO3457343.1 DUF928 domain-containing protein [Aetokthonos hydrillicola CCALA 1050]MBW4586692.1 DUF928 domain-containing protein [Aetokthonos hydrillicola CCALA 1050]MDR9893981.1 DUF928 domain-containing protein [Aetokthonos hydrillicola Thurmond2011]